MQFYIQSFDIYFFFIHGENLLFLLMIFVNFLFTSQLGLVYTRTLVD